ncbi:hypothetical protein [Metapseudomonas otitidis]|uniref:hypothetical protein n=1 Tax=Metapseudomonas otitidis TaxID=319939 RepID=UPI002448E13F|nr:hypothetical protein [Pseudomonas otitidis]MDG9783885.1 hypothetical protein [Pseudomonas otitidis]
MILDKEEHRQLILTLIDKAQFPGSILDHIVEFKKAVTEAKIQAPPTEEAADE